MHHADALRMIGRVLDAEEAQEVTIDASAREIAVVWATGQGARKHTEYRWEELDALQRNAFGKRGGERTLDFRCTEPGWSELLRSLGQNLEAQGAGPSTITGDLHWLTASWARADGYDTHQYSAAELWDASQRRAAARLSYA
jgi:hypothetical protein